MAESIAQQVSQVLQKNPDISNQDLYALFPKVRENTLRNYRSKFKNSSSKKQSVKKQKSKPTPRKTAKKDTSNELSLRGKVFEFFNQNPNASNQKLYEEFSDFSKNKLRHYKASFFKNLEATQKEAANLTASARKKLGKKATKKKAAVPTLEDLDQRIQLLEKKIEKLSRPGLGSLPSPGAVRGAITDTASSVEKKARELEENLIGFIAEQKKKFNNELQNLDDIQRSVKEKIRTFLSGYRDKNTS